MREKGGSEGGRDGGLREGERLEYGVILENV